MLAMICLMGSVISGYRGSGFSREENQPLLRLKLLPQVP